MPKVKPGWKCNHLLESFWYPKTRLGLIQCLFGTALAGKASCILQSTTESSLTDTITLFFYPLTTDKWPTYCAYKSLIFLLPLLLLRLLILPLQTLCFLKSSQVSKVGKRKSGVIVYQGSKAGIFKATPFVSLPPTLLCSGFLESFFSSFVPPSPINRLEKYQRRMYKSHNTVFASIVNTKYKVVYTSSDLVSLDTSTLSLITSLHLMDHFY